ncbi:TonB-dependent receptor domain-containing protein [Providencia sp. PROV086]|uniref:TonB-dependent receptor domain-containing protein n=1 Tax=Providencia sp. PROV086 TaxID=2949802 RepID=UPI00234AA35A|nr:TonB-dependent receptor [Providencia sp. PROV086]
MNKHSMRPVSRLLKLIIGVSPFMASGMMVAYAETQVSTQDITQLGPLKVSAKSQKELDAEFPYLQLGSSSYIDGKTVERFRGNSSADFLRGVSGVHLGDIRNGGALDVNIRGLQGQSRVPIIVDGTQQSIDVYRGYAGVQQRSYLDPDLISQVSIDKGPTLATDGAGAIGGAVRVTTLQPADVIPKGETFGVRLRGGMANNTVSERSGFYTKIKDSDDANQWPNMNSRFGSVAMATDQDRYQLLAAYAYRKQGNYFAGKHGADRYEKAHYSTTGGTGMTTAAVIEAFPAGKEVLDTHSRSESWLLKGMGELTKNQKLELIYRRYDASWGEIMPSMIMAPNSKGESTQFVPSKITIDALSAKHNFNPDNDWLNLTSEFWYTRSVSRMYNANIGNVPVFDLSTEQLPDPQNEEYKQGLLSDIRADRYGVNLTNRSTFESRFGEFNLTLGGSFQHEDTGPNSPILKENLQKNRFLRSGVRKEYSLSSSLEYKPVNWLTLQVGGRYTEYNVRDRNSTAYAAKSRTQEYTFARLKKNGEFFQKWPESWYMEWWPDEQGHYTLDSLKNTPYANSTLGDKYDFDDFERDPRPPEQAILKKEVTTEYAYTKPMERHGRDFSPQVGIAFHLDDTSQLYVKYSEAVKNPSIFESTLGNWTSVPAADLKPEKNKVLEIGASTVQHSMLTSDDKMAAKVAWFKSDLHNMITRGYHPNNSSWLIENVDLYKTSGIEYHLSYDQGRFYADVSGNYYLEAKTCDATTASRIRGYAYGDPNTPNCVNGGFGTSLVNLTNPPKYTINTTLGVRLLEERNLDIGVRRIYNSGPTHKLNQNWHTVGMTGTQLIYLSTVTYDAYANYQFNPNADINLTVTNLTNEYYVDPMALSLMPAPGRTFTVDFTYRF